MDYKDIIRSRKTRLAILSALSFVPDEIMLRWQYRIKMGRKLDLKDPQRFTEKLQWYKLHYRNPDMIRCVDKYDVRSYVKEKGLGSILVPCYGVYDTIDEINWDALPDQFVMKDTLGGGGASVVIVKDKAGEDLDRLKRIAREWTETDAHCRGGGREWPYYSGKKHRVLFEKYIPSDQSSGGLVDYKFFCFDGKAEYLYVVTDRVPGSGACVGVYNAQFQRLPVVRKDERPPTRNVQKPRNYETLKQIAEKLADNYPEVRIDLFDQNETILFSEVTFYDGSGYMMFEPDEFDYELGKPFRIPTESIVGVQPGVPVPSE